MFEAGNEDRVTWYTIQEGEFTLKDMDVIIEENVEQIDIKKIVDDLHARIKQVPIRNEGRKIGRNDECPCDSGLKFKKCCLLLKR